MSTPSITVTESETLVQVQVNLGPAGGWTIDQASVTAAITNKTAFASDTHLVSSDGGTMNGTFYVTNGFQFTEAAASSTRQSLALGSEQTAEFGGLSLGSPLGIAYGGTGAVSAEDAVTALTTVVQKTVNSPSSILPLAPEDSGTIIELIGSGAATVQVPTGLPAGFNCMIVQQSPTISSVTIVAGLNATVTSFGSLNKLMGQYASATLVKLTAENTFHLAGNLT